VTRPCSSSRTAVEVHLFGRLIPAAYRPHPDHPNRWTAAQATPYLAFLAHHLEHRLHTTSLAWWELPRAVPRPFSDQLHHAGTIRRTNAPSLGIENPEPGSVRHTEPSRLPSRTCTGYGGQP
jgi:hypothetical protein